MTKTVIATGAGFYAGQRIKPGRVFSVGDDETASWFEPYGDSKNSGTGTKPAPKVTKGRKEPAPEPAPAPAPEPEPEPEPEAEAETLA